MVAAVDYPLLPTSQPEEQRILLHGVPWSTYVVLRDSVDSPGVRMTYLRGTLEIMSPSRTHEVNKKQIARLLELFCLERGIPLYGYGSMTMRKEEKERGLEPDECYCRGGDKPVPDVALEVVQTRGSINKLDVYVALGVREVWVFEDAAFQIFGLKGESYLPAETSEVFPELDLKHLAHFAMQADQHAALVAYRDELRT